MNNFFSKKRTFSAQSFASRANLCIFTIRIPQPVKENIIICSLIFGHLSIIRVPLVTIYVESPQLNTSRGGTTLVAPPHYHSASLLLSLLFHHLCGLLAAVGVCGNHHVHALERLGALHAQQVVVLHAGHGLVSIQVVNARCLD